MSDLVSTLFGSDFANRFYDQDRAQGMLRDLCSRVLVDPVERTWREREDVQDDRNRERLISYRVKRLVLGV